MVELRGRQGRTMKIKLQIMVGLLMIFNLVSITKTMELLQTIKQPIKLEELHGQIIEALNGKEKDTLPSLLQQLTNQINSSDISRKGGRTSSGINPLQEALEIAQRSLKDAEKHMVWNDPPRLRLGGLGLFYIGSGLANGIYNITQFSNENVNVTTNTLSLVTSIILALQGLNTIFNVYNNSEAESDLEKARLIYAFIKAYHSEFDKSEKVNAQDNLSDLEV